MSRTKTHCSYGIQHIMYRGTYAYEHFQFKIGLSPAKNRFSSERAGRGAPLSDKISLKIYRVEASDRREFLQTMRRRIKTTTTTTTTVGINNKAKQGFSIQTLKTKKSKEGW
jgi:hypothetical protein